MALHDGDRVREECRRQRHPIDWHWADGRARRTCGFCGDELDHTQCATCGTLTVTVNEGGANHGTNNEQ